MHVTAWNRGDRRTPYRPYMRLWQQACRLEQRGDREAGALLRKQMKTLPSRDPADPGYRLLRYCRYADDWLLGFAGPRHEAEEIKAEIARFLREQCRVVKPCCLEVNNVVAISGLRSGAVGGSAGRSGRTR